MSNTEVGVARNTKVSLEPAGSEVMRIVARSAFWELLTGVPGATGGDEAVARPHCRVELSAHCSQSAFLSGDADVALPPRRGRFTSPESKNRQTLHIISGHLGIALTRG